MDEFMGLGSALAIEGLAAHDITLARTDYDLALTIPTATTPVVLHFDLRFAGVRLFVSILVERLNEERVALGRPEVHFTALSTDELYAAHRMFESRP